MERVQLNLGTEETVRALQRGDLPWTLHPACDFASDPGQWGASLINNGEAMIACLETAGAQSVVEEGADAYVIDGDHNYFTVTEEIRLIVEHGGEKRMPLLMFHDVGWPHARRDDYYAPEQIPDEYRQPTIEGGGLFPGLAKPRPGGLPYKWPAAEEGGPRNGVLTAVEDFVSSDENLRFAILPSFFGLGIVWDSRTAYSEALQNMLSPLDRNPIISRLEANRAYHLASVHHQMMEVTAARQRIHRQEALLRRLLNSSAFGLAEQLSRLRHRAGIAPANAAVSKQEVLKVLDD